MKAKELAEILLTVPEWEVCVDEDYWGTSPAKLNCLIDPRCKKGIVTLVAMSYKETHPQPEDDPQS